MATVPNAPHMPTPGKLRKELSERNLPFSSMLKPPRQHRSRKMVHAILDATLFVIEEEGADAFTTNRVAEVAGISVGSLYQYFENKEMLIAGAIERGVIDSATAVHEALEANAHAPARAVLRSATLTVAEGLKPYRKLLTHVFSMTPISGSTVVAILEERMSATFIDWLAARTGTRLETPPPQAQIAASAGVYEMIHWLTDLQDDIPTETFANTLGDMLHAAFLAALSPSKATVGGDGT